MRIFLRDFRRAGVCPNAKSLFFEKHGIPWRLFLKEGCDLDYLLSFNDKTDEIKRIAKIKRENSDG